MNGAEMGTYFITGATGGIGTEVAIALARSGHRLILSARSENSTAALLQRLHREVPGADVDIVMGDLSLMREVIRMSRAVSTLTSSLDGLVLNAGAAPARKQLTCEGIETGAAVNHFGPVLMAQTLMPLVDEGSGGRIVVTGSSDHFSVKQFDVRAASHGEQFGYTSAYSGSKFMVMASMFELARRTGDQHPKVYLNVADPGWTQTGLTRSAPLAIRMLVRLGKPIQNSAGESARLLVDLATNATDSGAYFGLKGPGKLSTLVQDHSVQEKVYNDTMALLEEIIIEPIATLR